MIALLLLLFLAQQVPPQQPPGRQRPPDPAKPPAPSAALAAEKIDETPAVTHHQIRLNGKSLSYTATAAQMPILNSNGETEAHIFHVAYMLDGTTDPSRRPLTFCFNGGRGSASTWVHMGAMGPRA